MLEDIESVSFEVIAVLIPLLESGRLLVPARADAVRAHPAFQLWATCTTLPTHPGAAAAAGRPEVSDPDCGLTESGLYALAQGARRTMVPAAHSCAYDNRTSAHPSPFSSCVYVLPPSPSPPFAQVVVVAGVVRARRSPWRAVI